MYEVVVTTGGNSASDSSCSQYANDRFSTRQLKCFLEVFSICKAINGGKIFSGANSFAIGESILKWIWNQKF